MSSKSSLVHGQFLLQFFLFKVLRTITWTRYEIIVLLFTVFTVWSINYLRNPQKWFSTSVFSICTHLAVIRWFYYLFLYIFTACSKVIYCQTRRVLSWGCFQPHQMKHNIPCCAERCFALRRITHILHVQKSVNSFKLWYPTMMLWNPQPCMVLFVLLSRRFHCLPFLRYAGKCFRGKFSIILLLHSLRCKFSVALTCKPQEKVHKFIHGWWVYLRQGFVFLLNLTRYLY